LSDATQPETLDPQPDPKDNARRGFVLSAGSSAAGAALFGVLCLVKPLVTIGAIGIVVFPLWSLAWNGVLLVSCHLEDRKHAARGVALAGALVLLVSCGCWATAAMNLSFS